MMNYSAGIQTKDFLIGAEKDVHNLVTIKFISPCRKVSSCGVCRMLETFKGGNVHHISHILRAFILTEFVTGVRPKDSGRESFSTKTKKGVIDGFVRHIKNAYTAVDKY